MVPPKFTKLLLLAALNGLVVSCGPNGSIEDNSFTKKTEEPPSRRGDDAHPEVPPGETSFDLTTCGFDLDKPGALLPSTRLNMDQSVITVSTPILGGIFQSKKDVTLTGNFLMESSLARQTIAHKATANPVVDATEVNDFTSNVAGGGEATLLGLTDRANIGEKSPEWRGIFCTLQPATRLDHNDDKHVAVEFSQPIPFGLLTTADATRMKTELGAKRTWTNVVGKIVESTNPKIAAGTALTGDVTLDAAPTTGLSGITADLAIRLTYNFGGIDKNKLIGLPAAIVWYIDTSTKAIKGVQVDTGSGKVTNYK